MSLHAFAAGVFPTRRPPLRYIVAIMVASSTLLSCLPGRAPPVTPTGAINAPAVPAASPTTLATDTPQPQRASGPCTDGAAFVEDSTIPDGTEVAPGATLDKRWLVENSGTCDWGPGYALVRADGPSMGVNDVTALFPARAGAEVEIQLSLVAPTAPGSHTTSWRMRNDEGEFFGDVLFISIVVSENAP